VLDNPLSIAVRRVENSGSRWCRRRGVPRASAGCCRGRVFLAGPMSGSLASWTAFSYRYRAQRERFPFCKTGAPSILAYAKMAPYPERASDSVMIGPVVPSYE
jgi:hypothetical protein